jgi:hypothetical protein
MPTLPLWVWKLLAAAALIAAVAGTTWFAADAHYTKQYTSLKSQYEQAAKDAKAERDATIAANKAAAERINNEAQEQIASMAAAIGDLSVRVNAGHGTIRVCPAPQGAAGAAQPPVGSTAAGSAGAVAGPQSTDLAIDGAILNDTLDAAIAAITAELQWRDYARSTGQE